MCLSKFYNKTAGPFSLESYDRCCAFQDFMQDLEKELEGREWLAEWRQLAKTAAFRLSANLQLRSLTAFSCLAKTASEGDIKAVVAMLVQVSLGKFSAYDNKPMSGNQAPRGAGHDRSAGDGARATADDRAAELADSPRHVLAGDHHLPAGAFVALRTRH